MQNKCDNTATSNINEANGIGDIVINGETVVSDANCSGGSVSGYIWIYYDKIFDTPQDFTITISTQGKFGVGPIGVTYAE